MDIIGRSFMLITLKGSFQTKTFGGEGRGGNEAWLIKKDL